MMRCLAILPGAPICEYVGVLRTTEEVDGLLQNNYIFDIDCLQTMMGLDGREVLIVSLQAFILLTHHLSSCLIALFLSFP
jgi:hypothetical protein